MIGRLKEASGALLGAIEGEATAQLEIARTAGDVNAVADLARRQQFIADREEVVFESISRIQEAFVSLGLGRDPIPVDGLMDPVISEPVDGFGEPEEAAVLEPLVDVVPVVTELLDEPDPFALPPDHDFLDDEPIVLQEGFEEDSDPVVVVTVAEGGRRVTAKELDGLPREERMIRAVFGLDTRGKDLHYGTFARATDAALSDILSPQASPSIRIEYGAALHFVGGFIGGLIRGYEQFKTDPKNLTEGELRQVKEFIDYLNSEGYPQNILPIDLWRISHRTYANGYSLRTIFQMMESEGRRPIFAQADSSQHKSGDRTGGFKPVKGPNFHVPEVPSRSAQDVDRSVAQQELVSTQKRMLEAILGMNELKEPVYAGLKDIALSLIGPQVADLPIEARDEKVNGYVARVITPFIAERVRAIAMVAQKGAGNVNLQQRLQANELIGALVRHGYPDDLSPSEIGQIVSRQTTLKALLARKEDASVSTATGSEKGDKGSARPAEKHKYKKVDRLNERQREYLDIVYAVTDAGEIKYPTREDALRAMYGVKYDEAVFRGDKKTIGLMKAHFARTGHALASMIQHAMVGNHAPAELRAKLQEIKNSPAFAGYDNSLVLQLAVRF